MTGKTVAGFTGLSGEECHILDHPKIFLAGGLETEGFGCSKEW